MAPGSPAAQRGGVGGPGVGPDSSGSWAWGSLPPSCPAGGGDRFSVLSQAGVRSRHTEGSLCLPPRLSPSHPDTTVMPPQKRTLISGKGQGCFGGQSWSAAATPGSSLALGVTVRAPEGATGPASPVVLRACLKRRIINRLPDSWVRVPLWGKRTGLGTGLGEGTVDLQPQPLCDCRARAPETPPGAQCLSGHTRRPHPQPPRVHRGVGRGATDGKGPAGRLVWSSRWPSVCSRLSQPHQPWGRGLCPQAAGTQGRGVQSPLYGPQLPPR